jgi:hypothetical protein
MTWQPQLQSKVRLVVDTDGPTDSIVKHYAWVQLGEPQAVSTHADAEGHHRDVESVLQAVMVSWAALALCHGYSGSENGAFWKRVISALQQDRDGESIQYRFGDGHRHDKPRAVTDVFGFFDLPDHEFPRFMIETPLSPALLTPDASDLVPEISDQLQSVLARLQMYDSRPSSRIDICLRMNSKYPFTTEDSSTLSALVHAVNDSSASGLFPLFHICKLDILGDVSFAGKKHIDGFLDLAKAVPVALLNVYFTPLLNKAASEDRAKWLYAFLRIDGHSVQADVASFHFPRHYMNDAVFQSLMSALPFARSTHSISFDTQAMGQKGSFEQIDLPWIAYAIFHPRASSSSWRHLELSHLSLTEYSTYVLTAMSRGNNLLAVLSGSAPTSDAYYSAQLVAGTVVEFTPRSSVTRFVELLSRRREKLFIVPDTTSVGVTVDVCGITSLDPTSWGQWVAVIVPAYGLGWVRAHELRNVRAQSPAMPSLSGLRLARRINFGRNRAPDDPPEAVLHMLRPLGTNLTFLDIGAYTDASASTLREVVHACPLLRTLVASHTGDLWSTGEPFETRLEEMELILNYGHKQFAVPTYGHINGSFRHLRALRLRVWDMEVDQLQASQAVLEQLLRHATALRYLHWRNSGADYGPQLLDRPVAYADSVAWTPAALEQLRLTDEKYLYAHSPLSLTSAAAFLSVVARESGQRDSALGRLSDRGMLLTNIFGFAASPTRRFLCIEPNTKYRAAQVSDYY